MSNFTNVSLTTLLPEGKTGRKIDIQYDECRDAKDMDAYVEGCINVLRQMQWNIEGDGGQYWKVAKNEKFTVIILGNPQYRMLRLLHGDFEIGTVLIDPGTSTLAIIHTLDYYKLLNALEIKSDAGDFFTKMFDIKK